MPTATDTLEIACAWRCPSRRNAPRTPGRRGMRTPRISSSRASTDRRGPVKNAVMGTSRRDDTDTTSTTASAA